MPRFAYRALRDGRVLDGQITSGTRERAIETLRRRRLVPIEVVGAGDETAGLARWMPRSAAGLGALLEFTRDLQVLLDAGVPLGRALGLLAEAAAGTSASMARRLLARVRDGASLSAAMEAERALFPSHYVGMVRAGEQGSSLPAVLARLAIMLQRSADLRAQIRSGLAYPILVLCLAGATIVMLLVFVIPEFKPVFEQAGAEAPMTARILISASDAARGWGWALGLGLLALLLAVRQAGRSRAGRLALDGVLLRTPLVGAVLVQVETARFCRTLGTLVSNEVPLLDAARISVAAISNRQLAAAMGGFATGLARGDDVLGALGRAGWLPRRVLQMAAVGVESGRLGEMLVRVAEIYEAEAGRAMQRCVGMIAPATTLLLGGLVGIIVWSVISTVLGSYTQALQ